MKKFIYLLAVAAIVAACSGNKGYVVTGTVEGGADGDTVFLQKVDGRNLVKVDSAVITKGTFTLQRCTRYCRKPLRDLQTGRKRRHINGLFP